MQNNLKREIVLNSLNVAYKKDLIFQKESFFLVTKALNIQAKKVKIIEIKSFSSKYE
jgi:hypothetical protein